VERRPVLYVVVSGGVRVILDPGHLPDDDNPGQAEFPWDELRAELRRMHTALAGGEEAPE
jgi:hypothetical protein